MDYIRSGVNRWALKIVAVLAVLLPSCDKGFEEMNKNPNAFTEPVIGSMFSTSLIKTAGTSTFDSYWGNMIYLGGYMQTFATLTTMWPGDKYLTTPESGAYFEIVYTGHLKDLEQAMSIIKDQPDKVNEYNIARILRVFIMHRVTDLYGDVPYREAGQGYLTGIYKPKYDRQSDIYPDMLKTLEEAASQLDPSKPSYGSADFIYNGSPAKWKQFAYSLMLRLGMRLTKIDPQMAEQYVKKAIAGGVIKSNADIAKLVHTSATGNNWNWVNNLHQSVGVQVARKGINDAKLTKTFIDYLQSTTDPRLPFYSTLWQGNASPSELSNASLPSRQRGLPNGYDNSTIKSIIPSWTNDMLAEFSETNLLTIGSLSAPTVFLSYTEVEYLLAEAALRGWDSGSPETHYSNAVTSSMKLTTIYPGNVIIPQSEIDKFLQSNPLTGTTDEKMEKIYTQLWVSHFMFSDNVEIFSSWRRTGYPKLTPVNYLGNVTGGTIPRRLVYPASETNLNTENYNAAIALQGADLYTTRVWWDK